jgi:hypothetical protein
MVSSPQTKNYRQMKHLKIILAFLAVIGLASCEKESRYPEIENGANAQFTRALGTTAATFNATTLSKANPTAKDNFTLKIVESGNVASVRLMVDYIKGTTTTSKQLEEVKTWPANYSLSLNDLTALMGITTASTAAGDRFVLRTEFTLKSGTVVSSQGAILAAAPYAIRLTYTVAN